MDEVSLFKARVKELSYRASSSGYITHTEFLSLSEQNIFYDYLKEEHIDYRKKQLSSSAFVFDGGHEEDDRKMIFFLPSYITEDEFHQKHLDEDYISCLEITPKVIKFAETLTHRDYLGALMNLGFMRNRFGDILTDGTVAYLFCAREIKDQVIENLGKVRHTAVDVKEIKLSECPFTQRFLEKNLIVASDRLDVILGEVFNLSRRSAQEVIAQENVCINGRTIMNNSFALKENQRVSVRGHGKFIFVSSNGTTKKGRLKVKVKVFA